MRQAEGVERIDVLFTLERHTQEHSEGAVSQGLDLGGLLKMVPGPEGQR